MYLVLFHLGMNLNNNWDCCSMFNVTYVWSVWRTAWLGDKSVILVVSCLVLVIIVETIMTKSPLPFFLIVHHSLVLLVCFLFIRFSWWTASQPLSSAQTSVCNELNFLEQHATILALARTGIHIHVRRWFIYLLPPTNGGACWSIKPNLIGRNP